MTNLEQSIKNALPDLMELGVGCVIKTQTGQILTMYSEDNRYCNFFNKDVTSTSITKPLSNTFEILGKPITLPDVLRWIEKIYEKEISSLKEAIILKDKIELLNIWNLNIPNLSDQPQPVKDFLSNLIEK